MMPSRSADTLFQLIHSLQKGEKRNFKLYVKRNSSNEDLKIIQLFDAIDKMQDYDEAALLKKLQFTKKEQLANRKTHLYKQILASLRLLESNDNADIQLREQLDYARILYNKGLYLQSLKALEKLKENAKARYQNTIWLQAIFMEKKIEGLHITRSLKDRSRQLAEESNGLIQEITLTNQLSNLSLELYGWFINYGHARSAADEEMLTRFFQQNIPDDPSAAKSFYQKLYLYQSYCWYAFIRLDYLMYYRYTQKWVDIFQEEPEMIAVETSHYIRGMHNLASAHFDLRNYDKFEATLKQFEAFAASDIVRNNANNNILVFVYFYTAQINRHFMEGTFDEGVKLVPIITEKLKEYSLYLDTHRVLVFYYKIASLYFGSGDYDNTVTYLTRIINWKINLRNDLQCYARLLHLIAHYELGNYELLEYLTKSVYRFMAKMENLSGVEEEIFLFLRKSFNLSPKQLKPEFEKLLAKLKKIESSKFESRAFAYLDIISWLESKISGQKVQDVIHAKYLERKKAKQGKTSELI
jgi:hypothetical protein